MPFLIPHGRVKPPFGLDRLNGAHPFVQGLLFGAWLNHPGVSYRGGGTPIGQDVIPSWGRTAPRTVGDYNPTALGLLRSNLEGPCFATGIADYIDFGADPMPAAQVTICLIRKKTDTTNRNGIAFGLTTIGTVAKRCSANVPYADGTTYWDFGGSTAGTTRLSVGGLTYSTTLPERWIFTAGPRGMAIWRNGTKVASHATANPGRTVDTSGTFRLNDTGVGGADGDLAEFNFFMALDAQWDDALCRWWSAEPYAHLYCAGRRRLVPVTPVAPAAIARSEAYVWGPL